MSSCDHFIDLLGGPCRLVGGLIDCWLSGNLCDVREGQLLADCASFGDSLPPDADMVLVP
jgi:hypothetical protein